MRDLLRDIRSCKICEAHLPLGCNPVVQLHHSAKIAIVGQAPGSKVHESGVPWADASGKNLRKWLGVSEEEFYNPKHFAIVPMGFCFPGSGKKGDLPPRPECAPQWHELIFKSLNELELILLVGAYAQSYYLKDKLTLTQRVVRFETYLPRYFPLAHPSPLNNRWFKKNDWYLSQVIPVLRETTRKILSA